ncbi:MAG TPA: hypothetical protein VFE46_13470 [Pirellulales bacterium]|jgi:hypothetical protein|nr:hypothetical protein [Pirellulales bacterium]
MKPTHDELCQALVGVGIEPSVLEGVRPEALEHLATLGLIHYDSGEWVVTPAGDKLLPALEDANEIPPLI